MTECFSVMQRYEKNLRQPNPLTHFNIKNLQDTSNVIYNITLKYDKN